MPQENSKNNLSTGSNKVAGKKINDPKVKNLQRNSGSLRGIKMGDAPDGGGPVPMPAPTPPEPSPMKSKIKTNITSAKNGGGKLGK